MIKRQTIQTKQRTVICDRKQRKPKIYMTETIDNRIITDMHLLIGLHEYIPRNKKLKNQQTKLHLTRF